jgi:RNA polymerase sigma factor (sigma-70 family)
MADAVPKVLASTDDDLVARIQNGQTESEAALYAKYSAKVYYVALRGSKSSHDAEDIRSETFLRVIQAIRGNQLRSKASLPAFILGVTRNVMNELYARRRAGANDVPADGIDLPVASHEQLFLDREARAAVRETIQQLRPRERAVLRMHFYDELPTPEVASRVRIAPERVRLVKSRALKHFRQVYDRLKRAARTSS